jgi:hypothetical protein
MSAAVAYRRARCAEPTKIASFLAMIDCLAGNTLIASVKQTGKEQPQPTAFQSDYRLLNTDYHNFFPGLFQAPAASAAGAVF